MSGVVLFLLLFYTFFKIGLFGFGGGYAMPTIEGGDAHYVSTNLAEVGSEKLRAASSGAAPASQGNNSNQQNGKSDGNQKGGDQ